MSDIVRSLILVLIHSLRADSSRFQLVLTGHISSCTMLADDYDINHNKDVHLF
jgi:hypothetical protein